LLTTISEPDANDLRDPELAPDGRRVAVDRTVQGNRDIWLMDAERSGRIRFTFDGAVDAGPIWSPDATKIAFLSARKGKSDLYVRPSNSGTTEELLLETPNDKWTQDWSRDGRYLLYREQDPKTGFDLKALAMTGSERTTIPVANTRFEERYGQFSPDGRWVAYATDESGQFEIVVQAFPHATEKWPVSTGGGSQPRWRADGKELYFIASDGTLMATSIIASGSRLEVGAPAVLFQARFQGGSTANPAKHQYAVSRDGRFLINRPTEDTTLSPITLILNWRAKP
jgi:Tol biopolymer transport system component